MLLLVCLADLHFATLDVFDGDMRVFEARESARVFVATAPLRLRVAAAAAAPPRLRVAAAFAIPPSLRDAAVVAVPPRFGGEDDDGVLLDFFFMGGMVFRLQLF